MTDKIQIKTDKKQYLSALYSHPEETPAAEGEDTPGRTLVLMIHGFPGHKTGNNDLYGDLEFLLADKKLHTLRFDFRGCGESDGREEDFSIAGAQADLRNVYKWAKAQGYKSFILIAEGFGATMAIMNLGMDVVALALLWPIMDVQAWYRANFAELELDVESRKRKYLEVDGHKYGLDFIRELKKAQIITDLREVFMPTLILHGAQDTVVPISHLDLAREYIHSRRIEITTFHDGQHALQKLNHRKMMFYHLVQFIGKYA